MKAIILAVIFAQVSITSGLTPARSAKPQAGRTKTPKVRTVPAVPRMLPAIHRNRPLLSLEDLSGTAIVSGLTASPATISFHATDPDRGTVIANSVSTITWTLNGGNADQPWALLIQANGTSVSGCPTIPVSAVTVSCSSASTGSCNNGSFPLSSTSQQVAGGSEIPGSSTYTVIINLSLADRWSYIATQSSCTLSLNYIVQAL